MFAIRVRAAVLVNKNCSIQINQINKNKIVQNQLIRIFSDLKKWISGGVVDGVVGGRRRGGPCRRNFATWRRNQKAWDRGQRWRHSRVHRRRRVPTLVARWRSKTLTCISRSRNAKGRWDPRTRQGPGWDPGALSGPRPLLGPRASSRYFLVRNVIDGVGGEKTT